MGEKWVNTPKRVRVSSLRPRGKGGHYDFKRHGMDGKLIDRLKRSRSWSPIYVIGNRVEDGHHRVIAAKELGLTYIDALVFTRVDKQERKSFWSW